MSDSSHSGCGSEVTCCSPALPVALGVATLLPGRAAGLLVMVVFALGFSLPLAAVIFGVRYGTWTLCRSRMVPWIRRAAGLLMLGLGFYFLI